MPGVHQNHSITPPPQLDRGEERLEGGDKDSERSLTSYCHGQNRLNLGRKECLTCHQSNQSRIVRNKTRSLNTFPPPLHSSRTQLRSRFSPSFPLPKRCRGTGNGGCDLFITRCLCRSFLLRGKTPHTLSLLQREVPLTGESSPQTSPK